MNGNSLNFLLIRNCRNCAPTQVSQRKLGKDSSSLQLKRGSEVMQTTCREYTQPRNLTTSRREGGFVRIRKPASPGCQNLSSRRRYCIVIMIESLFRDRIVSWVRIVNGINKYVSETSEEISIEERSTGDKHGNLLQRLIHEQNLLSISLPTTFLSMKEFGKTLISNHSIKVVLQCQNL